MSLDKIPHFIVVHGVQTGNDDDIESGEQIEQLIKSSQVAIGLEQGFAIKAVKYEDMNDEAQKPFRLLFKALQIGNPLTQIVVDSVLDLVGDVATSVVGTKLADKIRNKIKAQIMASYQAGHPVYLIAHSLGTVYCLDVVRELMADAAYYNDDDRDLWPVQQLITLGSPLGHTWLFRQRELPHLSGLDIERFGWDNFHHPSDPVVSGSIFGRPQGYSGSQGPVEHDYSEVATAANWLLQGHKTIDNSEWLFSHSSYWGDSQLGNFIVDRVWG